MFCLGSYLLFKSIKTGCDYLRLIIIRSADHNFTPSCGENFNQILDLPIKSLISVCSDKLIRTNLFPVKDARAATIEDFPTPGLPSIKIAEEFFN